MDNGKSIAVKTFSDAAALVKDGEVPYILLEPEYVTGLTEGEGSFTYGREGGSVRLRFALGLQEEDKNLVFAVKDFFGVGSIYWRAPAGHSKASWHFCVTKTADHDKIVAHFDQYPLKGLKKHSYDLWRRMYMLKRFGSGTTRNWLELHDLARQLSALATKGRRSTKPKYNIYG